MKILKYASQATERFPKEASFWMLISRERDVQGQYQPALVAAKRALQIDSKRPSLIPYIISLYAQAECSDSAIAFARVQIAAGANKDSIGNDLIPLLSAALQKAQAQGGDTRENWQATLDMAERVDSVASTSGSKFFIGVAAISVGGKVLNELAGKMQDSTFDKTNACATVGQGADLVQLAYGAMTDDGGAKYNMSAAGDVLKAYPNLVTFIGELKKAIPNCK